MMYLPSDVYTRANRELLLCTYTYLAHMTTPNDGDTLKQIVDGLKQHLDRAPHRWKPRDRARLSILQSAMEHFPQATQLMRLTRSKSGMTAAAFAHGEGDISVVFRGTGRGEWIDNGEGLSGIPEENTYRTYDKHGRVLSSVTVKHDFATDQQVQALNWFEKLAAEQELNSTMHITVSGHSKGGNKAQFIAMHSPFIAECFSFDGQGFSPEAIRFMQDTQPAAFESRRRKIISLSADNDYVNVLGERLMPPTHIVFVESVSGFHNIEAMLDNSGRLRPLCVQGTLSRFAEQLSAELMSLSPAVRQHAMLGVMNVFQNTLGEGSPVNGDHVSIPQTVAGLALAVMPILRRFR